jgi:hypothetical protein
MFNHLSVTPDARSQSCHSLLVLAAVAALMLSSPLSLSAQTPGDREQIYQAQVPLGAEALRLGGSDKVLYLLAMAEAEQFEGWRHVRSHGQVTLTDTSGAEVRFYPETIRFRVTVSTRKDLLAIPSYTAPAPANLNQFLLNLRFQLKMFRGLKQTVIRPKQAELIGVPEEVPYDERIYQLTFSLPGVPITDRCLLEVYSPSGERLARFHLELL